MCDNVSHRDIYIKHSYEIQIHDCATNEKSKNCIKTGSGKTHYK